MHGNDELTCKQFVELVTELLEQSLPPEVSAAIEDHLRVCEGCEIYLGQMRLTVRAVRGLVA